ncbi:MAG TPA: hypothetical protein VK936_06385, partial [Longimicrobiales bacterium]|nr:hypothetical protein [Longimicrobiales bacterium]
MNWQHESSQNSSQTRDADGDSRPETGNGAGGDGAGDQQDRRARGQEGATRDFQERVRDLDRAGTVDAPPAAAGGTGDADTAATGGGRRGIGRHAWTLGLAASSLALLAGTRGGAGSGSAGGGDVALDVESSDGFMPPEHITEQQGVSWDLHVSEHDRIDFFVEFLMGRNYDRTRTWLERIGKYGPMIQNELRERDMPED